MKSLEHAALGAVSGAVAVFVLFPSLGLLDKGLLWVGGVLLSVFIDLDHFVIARWMEGNWSNLRRAVSDPRVGLVDQEEVFAGTNEPMLRQYRLLSHLLLGGVLVLASASVDSALALLVSLLLYVHVVADLIRDTELA